MLRAARFAATLEFDIEPSTLEALPAAAPRLAGVSAERKRDELLKLLLARRPSRGLAPMFDCGLAPFVCPQLAALLFDLSAAAMEECCEVLKTDRRTRRDVVAIGSVILPDLAAPWSGADARQLLRKHGERALLDRIAVSRADLAAGSLPTADLDRLRAEVEAQIASGAPIAITDLAVRGDDLIDALGLAPGPCVGRLLDALLDHVIAKPEDNRRDELIDEARRVAPSLQLR